jgi:hypothetical protein
VKQVCCSFPVTPDAFAPVGTKLDVRHFRAGQEVDLSFQSTDHGFLGVMQRHGMDGGPVWLGDSKWQRRPGSTGTEGNKRKLPGTRMAGQEGASALLRFGVPVYRVDYKNSLVYVAAQFDADIGAYFRISDSINLFGRTEWNSHQGLPPFPTFVAPADEDLSQAATHDCQVVSMPLMHRMLDEGDSASLISQTDVDDARAVKAPPPVVKKKTIEYNKYVEARKKLRKSRIEHRKKLMVSVRGRNKERQDEERAEKLRRKRRVT